ncbi:hypothetical protein SELMODRAFT_419873 [Selaginella moellendorffii]|uniref:Uncharacterized protein n=1 Tax=Selaginella moellendorffii TaxID=88036 RepID=D8SAT7_SELML|nr:hypothetical protein SELMODRAFT_419873 [Selaginella moellendorffii]
MKHVPVRAPEKFTIGDLQVSPMGDFMYPIEYPEPPTAELPGHGVYELVRSEFYPENDQGRRMMRHLYTITREGGEVEKYQVGLVEDSRGIAIKGFSRRDWEDCAIPENGKLRDGERRCWPRSEMGRHDVLPRAVERLASMMGGDEDRIFPPCRKFAK